MSMVKMPMETKMSEVNLSVEQMSNSKNVCGEKGVWKFFPNTFVGRGINFNSQNIWKNITNSQDVSGKMSSQDVNEKKVNGKNVNS